MAPKTPPGQTRRQVFRFVKDRLLGGRPPTVREVQDAFKFRSVQSAREHLEALVDEGKLVKEPGVARGYRLADQPSGVVPIAVPLLGLVQAGALTEAIEDPDGGYIGVQRTNPDEELFALKVKGESMTGAGILPGDIVVVRRQSFADSGDIVVAMVDGEATVKRLRRERGKVLLMPENPQFEPIAPPPDGLALLGKVVEVRRYLTSQTESHAKRRDKNR